MKKKPLTTTEKAELFDMIIDGKLRVSPNLIDRCWVSGKVTMGIDGNVNGVNLQNVRKSPGLSENDLAKVIKRAHAVRIK